MGLKFRHGLALLIPVSFFLGWAEPQAFLMLFYSLLILWSDFRNFRVRRLDISTAYALLLALTSVSHIIALFGLSDNPWFFLDSYPREVASYAILIFNVGSICLIEAIRTVLRSPIESEDYALRRIVQAFPFFRLLAISIILFLVSVNFRAYLLALGSFGSFLSIIIEGSVLLLSFIAHYKRRFAIFVFVYTMFLSFWALQYSYLRMEILIPVLAYLAGDLIAARSIRRMHILSKGLLIACIVIFPPLFTFLGSNRTKVWGEAKVAASLELFEQPAPEDGQTIMSRLSVVPQLSSIIKLTEKNGFYEGYTMQYFAYVLIPRFIWPEKPLIMQGQWFALEIGAAYKKKNGSANNSINMTVPGEFYLNFGWPGVLLGSTLFGIFVGWIWSQTNYETIFGWVFRFYLIFLGLFSLGADLQIVPTLIAYVLLYHCMVFINSRFGTPYRYVPPMTPR